MVEKTDERIKMSETFTVFLSICTMHYNHHCLCRWSQFEWQLIENDQMFVCLCETERILGTEGSEYMMKVFVCEPTEALFGYF